MGTKGLAFEVLSDDQQAAHQRRPQDAGCRANQNGIGEDESNRQDCGRVFSFTEQAAGHAHHDGADDHHIEAADGDDMGRADTPKIFFQIWSDAGFVAQHYSSEQGSLRIGQGALDLAMRRVFESEQGRVNWRAVAGTDNFDRGILHDRKHALPAEIVGVGECIPSGGRRQAACRANAVAVRGRFRRIALDQDQTAGLDSIGVNEDFVGGETELNALIAQDRLINDGAGYGAMAAIELGEVAGLWKGRLTPSAKTQREQRESPCQRY